MQKCNVNNLIWFLMSVWHLASVIKPPVNAVFPVRLFLCTWWRPGSCLHLVVMWAHWRWCTVKSGWVSEGTAGLVRAKAELLTWSSCQKKQQHIIWLNAHSLKGAICKIVCCWVSFRSSNTDVLGWWPARPDPTHSNILHTAPSTKNFQRSNLKIISFNI